MISAEGDMNVVAEAGTGEEAVRMYFEFRPSVLLLDLLLPDMDGAEAIQRICSKSGNASVIVVTTLGGDEDIYRALEAGARGYLFKDMVRRELIQAIRTVLPGENDHPRRCRCAYAGELAPVRVVGP